MRKILRYIALILPIIILISGCSINYSGSEKLNKDSGKLKIVATLFPQYDFAKQIGGDKVDVHLLLPPGMESHTYEPTPADIIAIDNSDLFLYTGEYMEPWARSILDGVGGDVNDVDVSKNVIMDTEEHDHEHETKNEHLEHGGFDPHIWTSPENARVMASDIAVAMEKADPENADYYMYNAARYDKELESLDSDLLNMVNSSKRKEIVFGGRFALHYFTKRYNLSYIAAFDSCSAETEPSVRSVTDIVDKIKHEGLPIIYYEELTDPKVARAISQETGIKALLIHSCHNVSYDDIKAGATYISLMRKNLDNLREGLN